MTALLVIAALALGALLLGGPARAGKLAQQTARLLLQERAVALGAAALVMLPPIAGKFYIPPVSYLARAAVGLVTFFLLLLVLERYEAVGLRLFRMLNAVPLWALALAVAAASVVAGVVVLENIPHVSDEVAYQFQARALATGHLAIPPAEPKAAFSFLHTIMDGTKWYGIMNPGWPAILALGYVLHLPWLMNPLCGAFALLALAGFFTQIGVPPAVRRLAILFLAVSPFVVFMGGSWMSHPVNLLCFALFGWAWARALRTGSLLAAALAGVLLGANILIRPVDVAAASVPFMIQGLLHLRRRPALFPALALTALLASGGVGLTLAYDRALTGDALLMPTSKYFIDRNPHEKFGLGFGAEMGTKLHGDEWPGFYPTDAVKVTGYRLAQFLEDVEGLPFVLAAAMLLGLKRRRAWDEWELVIYGSGAAVAAIYFFHFYHGVAYGSRHYYLALPAAALLLARPLAQWTEHGESPTGVRARLAVVALVGFTLLGAYPARVREYSDQYRGASGQIRTAVQRLRLSNALVFVDPSGWAWKSAFPLNTYPLEQSPVVFAKDLGPDNAVVRARFPGRTVYRLRLGAHGAELNPAPDDPAATAPAESSGPGISFSTLLGGRGSEMARDVATDAEGNVYVAGSTTSPDFPTTPGALQRELHGSGDHVSDGFITKFAPDGRLVWSTLLGGPGFDRVYGLEVDERGAVYVAGRAGEGFPVTPHAMQARFAGGTEPRDFYGPQDGFVCKLRPDGGAVEFCTYFGNDDYVPIRDLAIDAEHDIYIISSDSAGNFPSAWFTNAYQKRIRGGRDALIAKLSGDGSRLLWATYLGGSGDEGNTNSIRVDGTAVYVDLFTHSADMPTPNGFDHTLDGPSDVFAAKLSLDGTRLLYGTYIGGSAGENTETHHLAVDRAGNAIVAAQTSSLDFPTTAGALQPHYGGGIRDCFVVKLSPTGALLAASYLGGSAEESLEGVAVDSAGIVYLSGSSGSPDFPPTAQAGGRDAYALALSPDLHARLFAGRYGGRGNESARGAVLSPNGRLIIVGQSTSIDWPGVRAAQSRPGGGEDAFVVELEPRGRL